MGRLSRQRCAQGQAGKRSSSLVLAPLVVQGGSWAQRQRQWQQTGVTTSTPPALLLQELLLLCQGSSGSRHCLAGGWKAAGINRRLLTLVRVCNVTQLPGREAAGCRGVAWGCQVAGISVGVE